LGFKDSRVLKIMALRSLELAMGIALSWLEFCQNFDRDLMKARIMGHLQVEINEI
jgi:hypothetical protein